MAVKNRQLEQPNKRPVDLAVEAVVGPLDVMDMSIDTSPTNLGLNDGMCANERCACTPVDRCPTCGCPLCEE